MIKNVFKNVIKNVGDIKLSVDCFLVNILENEGNLVLDNQKNIDDVIVFNRDVNWKWNDADRLELHIWDNENKISLLVNELEEDEDSFDRLYVNDLLLTVL
ncbi:MAG: hypothetical protein ACLSV2_01885 [Clostridium sp.]